MLPHSKTPLQLLSVVVLTLYLSLAVLPPLTTLVYAHSEVKDEDDDKDKGHSDDNHKTASDSGQDKDKDDEDDQGRAQDNHEEEEEHEEEKEEERRIETEMEKNEARIQSRLEREGLENKLDFRFASENGIVLILEFESEKETTSNQTEAAIKITVAFLRLIEFLDRDASRTLTANDTILQQIDLRTLDYSRPTLTPITSADNEIGQRVEAHTTGALRFQVYADLFPRRAVINGTRLNPTETKITITIENYPFKNTTSLLALQIQATSKEELETKTGTTEREVRTRSATAEGYFSWSDTATVNNQPNPVHASITSRERQTFINLAYPQGAKILHDPILGIHILTPTLQLLTPLTFQTSLLILTAIALVLIAVSRKQM